MRWIIITIIVIITLVLGTGLFFYFGNKDPQTELNKILEPIQINIDDLIQKEAEVDQLAISIQQSPEFKITAIARGFHPNSCTRTKEVKKDYKNNHFAIKITVKRDEKAVCAQVLTPYEERIPLNVGDKLKGNYTIKVNGVNGSFQIK